jgi:uncharacterized membrane protein
VGDKVLLGQHFLVLASAGRGGMVRRIDLVIAYERLVKGAGDKIRQAGRGMPAVYIRQLQNLEEILQYVVGDEQPGVIVGHADMILRASEESVAEHNDRLDVQAAYDLVVVPARRVV